MPTKSRSQTTIRRRMQAGPIIVRRLPTEVPPTHPGEMLIEEFIKPLQISQSAFAVRLGISFPRLNEMIRRKRSVTPDTALRLARVTGISADFWLGLQQDWDLWHALRSKKAAAIGRRATPALGLQAIKQLQRLPDLQLVEMDEALIQDAARMAAELGLRGWILLLQHWMPTRSKEP